MGMTKKKDLSTSPSVEPCPGDPGRQAVEVSVQGAILSTLVSGGTLYLEGSYELNCVINALLYSKRQDYPSIDIRRAK